MQLCNTLFVGNLRSKGIALLLIARPLHRQLRFFLLKQQLLLFIDHFRRKLTHSIQRPVDLVNCRVKLCDSRVKLFDPCLRLCDLCAHIVERAVRRGDGRAVAAAEVFEQLFGRAPVG